MLQAIFWLSSLFVAFLILIIFLSLTGKSTGIRELCARCLLNMFEWASEIRAENEAHLYDEEEDRQIGSSNKKKIKVDDNRPLIDRHWSATIDNKLHDPNYTLDINKLLEPDLNDQSVKEITPTRLIVREVVRDSLEFLSAGVEAIVEDEVTSRFKAAQLSVWNLLARNRNFVRFNWKLHILWFFGLIFRYLVLLPVRFMLFVTAFILICVSCFVISYVPSEKTRIALIRYSMLMFMGIFKFHNKENRPENGIVVANHTSPIDVMILSCDNCYSLIGQKHGGILGFFQRTVSRCSHHIWFERSEAKDRTLVRKALKEHIEDPTKMPILIFPEGTCINNTSVMLFKKGSFEVSDVVHPIAMRYDNRLGDAFWNSSQQGYFSYMMGMMTSWALMCDVWYLPPVYRELNEDPIDFARRVKRMIAQKGGLVDLEWDGNLKRSLVPDKLKIAQKDLFFDYLARTTPIRHYSPEDIKELNSEEDNPPEVVEEYRKIARRQSISDHLKFRSSKT